MVSTASPERSAKGEVLREKQKHQRVEVRMPHAAITGQADVCQGDAAGFIPIQPHSQTCFLGNKASTLAR